MPRRHLANQHETSINQHDQIQPPHTDMPKPVNTIDEALTVPDGNKRIMTPAPAKPSDETRVKAKKVLAYYFLLSWQVRKRNSDKNKNKRIAAYSTNPEDAMVQSRDFYYALAALAFFAAITAAVCYLGYAARIKDVAPQWLFITLCLIPAYTGLKTLSSVRRAWKNWPGWTAPFISREWNKWRKKLIKAGVAEKATKVIMAKKSRIAGAQKNKREAMLANSTVVQAEEEREDKWTDTDRTEVVNCLDECLLELAELANKAMADGKNGECRWHFENFANVFEFFTICFLKPEEKSMEFYIGEDNLRYIKELK